MPENANKGLGSFQVISYTGGRIPETLPVVVMETNKDVLCHEDKHH